MRDSASAGERIVRRADEALSVEGAAYVPAEATSASDALLDVLGERLPDLTEHHSGVCRWARLTARRLGLPAHEVERTALAGQLHDIGKAAIPDTILAKPTSLDEREWQLMRQHTILGELMVRGEPSLAHTAKLIRSSHERFDGKGYPDGLSANEIPIGAAIVAVCDAFDAMVSDRSYRAAMPEDAALAELRRCAGTQFDPAVVEAFTAVVIAERSTAPIP
jgi:two-component system cell cycle response regulator